MSHKTEAEKLLSMAYNETSDSGGFFEVQAAFAEATLALAEAQERANEQARIANLIALAGIPLQNGYENETYDARNAALFEGLLEFSITSDDDERCSLRPEIARALGIEVAE